MTQSVGQRNLQASRGGRVMFAWTIGAAIIIGIALVVSLVLVQRIMFNGRVLAEKSKTESTLTKNIAAIPQLRNNIRVLDTNDTLKSVRLQDTDRPIQSVLDALPADSNDTALGSSLTTKIVGAVPGVTLESLTVEPVEDDDTGTDGLRTMNFTLAVSVSTGNIDALRQLLLRTEQSIRVFEFTGISVENAGTRRVMTLSGHAYYAPPKTMQLKDKVVR